MSKPIIGQEYAAYVEASELTNTGPEEKPLTWCKVGQDLDADGTQEIYIYGYHPGLQGIAIVVPVIQVVDTEYFYWRLVK